MSLLKCMHSSGTCRKHASYTLWTIFSIFDSHIESAQRFRHLAFTFHRKYIAPYEFCYLMKESAGKFPTHSRQVQEISYTLAIVTGHISEKGLTFS